MQLLLLNLLFSRGKELFSPRTHGKILYVCGAFMAVFGLWFLANYNNISAFV
jgi:hypothetical protein